MPTRRTKELLSALTVLALCGLAAANKPKPPNPQPPANHQAMEAHNKALHAQFQAALEAQKRALAAHIKAAVAAHQKALAEHLARHHEALAAARKAHEAHLKAAEEAERVAHEARKKAATREEKEALARQEKEAREAKEKAVHASHHTEALQAQQKHIHKAAAALSPEHLAVLHLQPGPFVSPLVQQLHQVRVLLEHADHDYQGHRAAAVQQISHAISVLDPKNNFKDKDRGGNGEPQALSDAQLGEAVLVLANDAAVLSAIPHAKAAKAFGHVAGAILDLEMALRVK
jgi:hypothetical protein